MTAHDDAIKAGIDAALRAQRTNAIVASVVDAVTPIIRADALAEFEGATVMDRRAWRDEFVAGRVEAEVRERLRAQVEALLAKVPRRRMAPLTYDTGRIDGRRAALADVLALLGGESDGS